MSEPEITDSPLDRLSLFDVCIDNLTGSSRSKKTIVSLSSQIRNSNNRKNQVVFELRYPNVLAGDLFINQTRVAKTSYDSTNNQVAEIISEHKDGDFIDLDTLRHGRNTHTILSELVPDKTFRDLFFPRIKNNGFYLRTKITQQDVNDTCPLTTEQLNEVLVRISKNPKSTKGS